MTKSARGEFYNIYQDCKKRLEGGVGTEYDEVIAKVYVYVASLENLIAHQKREQEFILMKQLSGHDVQIVINETLAEEAEKGII